VRTCRRRAGARRPIEAQLDIILILIKIKNNVAGSVSAAACDAIFPISVGATRAPRKTERENRKDELDSRRRAENLGMSEDFGTRQILRAFRDGIAAAGKRS
jgi:hypothetical protein